MRCIIDADYLVYNSGFAGEHNFYAVCNDEDQIVRYDNKRAAQEHVGDMGGHLWHRMELEPIENVLHSCKLQITKIVERVASYARVAPGSITPEVYLTGSANYRDRWATIRPYKGNRNPLHKPVYMREVRQYLVDRWDAKVINWMEADDMVSIIQTQDPEGVCVVGIDKDLLQVPGLHYVPKKGFKNVTERMGLLYLYRQILIGDATDNIAGCYKIGKGIGTKLIKTAANGVPTERLEEVLWPVVLGQYERSLEKHGPESCGYTNAENAALENAALVYMLREMPIDPAYPQSWQPKL